jgi:hypothetical protein
MSFILKKASKQAKKLRILLSASSGSGKTYGSLLIANGITGDWSKICVIDTERDSASIYSDLGEFNTIPLDAPYTPERYIQAITVAEEAGMEVIIIDSITHEWSGSGGCLDMHNRLGGKFQDWGIVTPKHNAFIDKMLRSSAHIIATVRRKEEYALTQSSNGRMQVEKMGMGEVQRDGINYEFDIVFEILNSNHYSKATKDRTRLFINKEEGVLTKETGEALKKWASQGRSELDDVMDLVRTCTTIDDLRSIHQNYPLVHDNIDYQIAKDKKKEELLNK